jgi:hypothetical protein
MEVAMFRDWIKVRKSHEEKDAIISYFKLRQFIGLLGILLPLICYGIGKLFKHPLQQSISFYYYSNVQDFFVGILVAVSVFLITYKGFRVIENIITWIIGVAGFGIALFPCLNKVELDKLVGVFPEKTFNFPGAFPFSPDWSSTIHCVCGIIFFLLLAINSFLFTLPEDNLKYKDSGIDKKTYRNMIYWVCGGVIIISLIILAFIYHPQQNNGHKVFFFETIMLVAFGISWLVKGKTLYDLLKLFGVRQE